MLNSIISEVNKLTSLPVDVEQVVGFILRTDLIDRIHFVPTDQVPSGLMCGAFERRNITVGWGSLDVATITYNSNDSIERQRLTCFKELVHIFDGVFEETDTADEIRGLVQELASPDGVSLANLMVLKDRFAEYLCLPLAVPEPLLLVLREEVRNGSMSPAEVAKIVALPEEYIVLMLSDEWADVVKKLSDIFVRLAAAA